MSYLVITETDKGTTKVYGEIDTSEFTGEKAQYDALCEKYKIGATVNTYSIYGKEVLHSSADVLSEMDSFFGYQLVGTARGQWTLKLDVKRRTVKQRR